MLGSQRRTGGLNPITQRPNPQISFGLHSRGGSSLSNRLLRDQKNVGRYSDSLWFWQVAEGIPKTKMKAWKSLLSEKHIWQVMAFEHQFSH